jgi:hypothetical protein
MIQSALGPFDAARMFNDVMARHSMTCRADAGDFGFGTSSVILGSNSGGANLAGQLFDELFRPSPAGTYHHYTSYGGFKGIVSTGTLRLYNLHKRFNSGEFRTFCRDHGLDGYLREENPGEEIGHFDSLMRDLYYTSLVSENAADSDLHWDKFANGHKGVRLSFEVKFHGAYPNFRSVAYQDPDCHPALRDLQSAFRSRGWFFVNLGLSRMGGFYQRRDFSSQFEHRLLAKRFPGDETGFPFAVHDERHGAVAYIESDLTTSNHPWFNLKLVSVKVGRDGSRENVESYLSQHEQFRSVVLT